MKISFAPVLLLAVAPLGLVDAKSSLNVGSIISSFFPQSTPSLPAGASTTLASALNSVETAWTGSNIYTAVGDAIYSAAPSSLQSSISKSGYYYESVVTADWFTKNAPKSIQTAVASHISKVKKVETSVFSKVATETSKGGAGAMATGVGMMGAAAALGLGGMALL